MVALIVSPAWAAASRTSSTRSLGRLIDSFVWGARESSAPYGATVSAKPLTEYDRCSSMVGRTVA